MIAKCACPGCGKEIEFDSAEASRSRTCPGCGKTVWPSTPYGDALKSPATKVESSLDTTGQVFCTIGIGVGVLCGLAACILISQGVTLGLFLALAAGASISLGFVLQILFGALAEIIRLLRVIAAKK